MTREEQIELMKECIEDAELVLVAAHDPLLPPSDPTLQVAFKFFDYRTRGGDAVNDRAEANSVLRACKVIPSAYTEILFDLLDFGSKMDPQTTVAAVTIMRASDSLYYDAHRQKLIPEPRQNPMLGKYPRFNLLIPLGKLPAGKYAADFVAYDANLNFQESQNIFVVRESDEPDIPCSSTDKAADVEED